MPQPSPNLDSLKAARQALDDLIADAPSIERIDTVADCLTACFQSGSKVLICGNGGSACDAMHFAEEFTGRFRGDRPPLPAIALTDPAHLTCTANDYGFEFVFSRLVEAYARMICRPARVFHNRPLRESAAHANERLIDALRRSPAFRDVPESWEPTGN